MIKIEFTEEQINTLFEEKTRNEHPLIRKKADVLYLKSIGLPHGEILKITRLTEPTLVGYLNDYKNGGMDKIKQINYYRPKSELDKFEALLKGIFEENPPRNSACAGQKIEEVCGIKRSPTQVRAFLKRIGMKIRKTGYIPGRQTDVEKQEEQEEFKKKL